jgi:hypothetical protein
MPMALTSNVWLIDSLSETRAPKHPFSHHISNAPRERNPFSHSKMSKSFADPLFPRNWHREPGISRKKKYHRFDADPGIWPRPHAK